MAASDPVDTTSLILTEAEAYMVGGYLAELWCVAGDAAEDIELAISSVLAKQYGYGA